MFAKSFINIIFNRKSSIIQILYISIWDFGFLYSTRRLFLAGMVKELKENVFKKSTFRNGQFNFNPSSLKFPLIF